MKKNLLLTLLSSLFILTAFSQNQSARMLGVVEKKMTDSLCNCVSKLDLSKITTKEEAIAAYTECVEKHSDILVDLAAEQHIEMTDVPAMKKLGIGLAVNLMKSNCQAFTKLSVFFAKGGADSNGDVSSSTEGKIKRMDNKGFNYLIITDNNASEKSFLWLRQFPGSEKLTNGVAAYLGKKVVIKWQELEVYLPAAKGYYKVKEITGITFL